MNPLYVKTIAFLFFSSSVIFATGCGEQKQSQQSAPQEEQSLASLPQSALPEGPLSLPAGSNAGAAMHNEQGISHYNQDHYDVALKHFKEAAQADATLGEIHFNEALALDKMGDHGGAAQHFQKAKKYANGNPKILESSILNSHIE